MLIRRWADQVKANKEDLAAICTMELGKPYTESLGTVKYATDFLDWFEGAIERQYGETIPAAKGNNRIFTIRQPQGVVAAITPWNSPVSPACTSPQSGLVMGMTYRGALANHFRLLVDRNGNQEGWSCDRCWVHCSAEACTRDSTVRNCSSQAVRESWRASWSTQHRHVKPRQVTSDRRGVHPE